MRNLSTWLKRRKVRNRDPFPSLHWLPSLLVTASMVVLAFFVFDGPVTTAGTTMSPLIRDFGRLTTDIGKSGWILGLSAILFLIGIASARIARSGRVRLRAIATAHIAAYVFISIALSGITANLLKRVIGRARPGNFDEWGTFGFSPFRGSRFESFPSGHATTIGALFMALALLLPRYRLLFLVLGVWIGMTRVMVGAHYPSDVVAGLAYGAWFALLTAIVFSRYQLVFRLSGDGLPVPRRELFRKPKAS